MVPTVPLFPGVPGGIEVLLVLVVIVLLGGGGILLFGLLVRGSSNDAEVERLERRVEELERERDDRN